MDDLYAVAVNDECVDEKGIAIYKEAFTFYFT